jgi:hypothetical protein
MSQVTSRKRPKTRFLLFSSTTFRNVPACSTMHHCIPSSLVVLYHIPPDSASFRSVLVASALYVYKLDTTRGQALSLFSCAIQAYCFIETERPLRLLGTSLV